MKYKLDLPFKSISGVVTRKVLEDGTTISLIAKNNGTLYWKRKQNYCAGLAAKPGINRTITGPFPKTNL
jgi:hypothetical protein